MQRVRRGPRLGMLGIILRALGATSQLEPVMAECESSPPAELAESVAVTTMTRIPHQTNFKKSDMVSDDLYLTK